MEDTLTKNNKSNNNIQINNNIKIYHINIEKNINKYYFGKTKFSNNLKNFISNRKKFILKSAFDKKGAKLFLKSKEEALKKINLEEEILFHKISDEKLHIKNEEFKSIKTYNELEKKKLSYRKGKKMNSLKLNKKKGKYQLNVENSNIDNENSIEKKKSKNKRNPSKFCSKIELRMYNDKDINKLKPIKESFQNLSYCPLSKKNSKKSDLTIKELLDEIL